MMDIKVLGTGCTNCKNTIALIDQVAQAKGVAVTLQKVEELLDIMVYGVMSTPRYLFTPLKPSKPACLKVLQASKLNR